MSSTSPGRDPTAGFPQRFGHYVLLAKLATGGMGEVFLARHRETHERFEKLVVVKRLLAHLMEQPKFVAMFKDEARIAARISHSNVCQTFELGEADGTYYMSMEYLEGVSLGKVIQARRRERRLADLRFLGRLLGQVCEGLHSAHELRDDDGELIGVVHRDVCHANLFVTSTGVAKVLDFGVAKARGAMDKTRTGAVKGTYAYSAPEQLRGEGVDRRADVFSLGVVAWEAVTGRRLFKRETDYLVFKAINEEPIPGPQRHRPDMPPPLAIAIERALSREPSQRFPTARDFGLAIAAALKPLGPPLGSVAAAGLMEDAFASELREQRRMCGISVGDDTGSLSTGEATLAGPTIVRDTPRLELPLRARDSQPEIRVVRRGEAVADDEPVFTYTPVDSALPYSQVTPLPQGDEAPTEEVPMAVAHGASAAADANAGETLMTEQVPPVPVGRGSGAVAWLFLLGLVAVGVVGGLFVMSAGDGERERVAMGVERTETGAGVQPAPARTPEPDRSAHPERSAPEGGARSQRDPEPELEAQPQPEPEPQPQPQPQPESDTARVADTATVSDGATASGTDTASDADTEPDTEPEAEPERERERPKPRPRPAKDPGFLTIDARPYAEVFVDGKRLGITPLVGIKLAAGTHSVRAVSSVDGAEKRFNVKVLPGGTTRKKIVW